MITVLNTIDPNTKLGKMQLAAIATEDITDDQFEKLFLNYDVGSAEEIITIVDLLEKHRPVLYDKYEKKIANLE